MPAASAPPCSAAVPRTAALICVLLSLGGCGASTPPGKRAIGPATSQIRCVNEASGAAWTVALDRAHGLADGQPATYGGRTVTWGQPMQGAAFALDEMTGVLTVSRGSSTGGWVSTFACAAAAGRA
jgi:hypothetical protein